MADLAAEPALAVLLLAALTAFVVLVVLLRLRRSVRAARARGALADWLLGAEEAFAGSLASARQRLQRVVEQDPENHGARTLLGETLLQLGEPTAAHEHLLTLRQAFRVDNRRVAWGLAQALAAAGRAADAVDALAKLPRSGEATAGLRQRLALELAAGLPEEVVRTADALLARAPRSEAESASLRRVAAHAFALLRQVRAEHGDTDGAETARREAIAALQDLDGAGATLRRRLLSSPATVAASERALLAAPQALPASVAHVASSPTGRALEVLNEFAADVVEAPLECPTCGMTVSRSAARCPFCCGAAPLRLREPDLHRELGSAAVCSDEIEETEAHLQRLVDRAFAGDTEAREELVDAGARAVGFVYRRALCDAGARDVAVHVLQVMGSGVLDALLEAYERAKADATLPAGAREAGPEVMGRVVRTFGVAALPVFQAHLDADDRDLRKIVLDFYLGLDDPETLQAVLDRYPPVEVIQRLNLTPADRLQAWLRNMPMQGFVAEVLLVHPMFRRDEDVLLAAACAPSPAALLAVLARRGASHDLATFAVDRLHDEAVTGVAAELLRSYGLAAADALLAGYLDLDRSPSARELARGLLAELGPGIVPRVCLCLGASPSRMDDEIVSLLVALGDVVVDELHEAYAKRNLLERVGGRLVRRYNHPRNTILKVLARVGGERARAVLVALRSTETDPNLKLRLDQALQVVMRVPALPGKAGGTSAAEAGSRPSEDGDSERKDAVG
ncbi:MAG: tetratricopeptide repeat protein [Planctomycetota bacterium]